MKVSTVKSEKNQALAATRILTIRARRCKARPGEFHPAAPRSCAHLPSPRKPRAVAESPCAWVWRRPNPAARGGFRGRIRPGSDPATPRISPRKFTEIYRILSEFIQFFRNSRILERSARRRHDTRVLPFSRHRKCGELRGQASIEGEVGLPGEESSQIKPTSQVTPERLVSRYRKRGEMRLPPLRAPVRSTRADRLDSSKGNRRIFSHRGASPVC